MLISTDCPENLNYQVGKGFNRNVMHTECVNEEIVLDLIYIPTVRLFQQRKNNPHEILQVVHLLTNKASVMEFFQYIVSSGGRFNKNETSTREKRFHLSAASCSRRCFFSSMYAMNKS